MKRRQNLLISTTIVLGAIAFSAGPAAAETIAISCGAVGQELALCEEGTKAWSEKTGHEVNIVSTPNSATERLALYQHFLLPGFYEWVQ